MSGFKIMILSSDTKVQVGQKWNHPLMGSFEIIRVEKRFAYYLADGKEKVFSELDANGCLLLQAAQWTCDNIYIAELNQE